MSAEEPRRLTPTERLHDIARLMAERPAPVSGVPSFHGAQTKAVGGATVNEWDVHVPVCDEFPTADKAFTAFEQYVKRMQKMFPPSTNGGEK